MHKGYSKNQYGTKISEHVCDECGMEFTVCPAQDKNVPCLGDDCPSYNRANDVMKLLEDGAQLKKETIH